MRSIAAVIAAIIMIFTQYSAAYAAERTSDIQITEQGGANQNTNDKVTVSKTIEGTELENVFDITLKVTTTTDIKKLTQDPDMAVVVVMDISNTMRADFGSTTRYNAAISSFNHFTDLYRQATADSKTSKIGFVAFNTNAMQIAAMTEVKTAAQATAFKNTVSSGTRAIINAGGYDSSHSRFTNIEGGLKRGYDMIRNLSNQNKFIVFLSDGFPTTYVKSGYNGYDPYTPNAASYTEGVFYDAKIRAPASYGTSYSERAAVKARQQAVAIKNAGVEIFTIGIDVGGQTIQLYDTHTHADGFSVIDRPNTSSYEIGSASSVASYKNWLRGSASAGIGSGYYYDSTNQSQMDNAFQSIFNEMKTKTEERTARSWQVTDPMGKDIELIGFYNIDGTLVDTNLSGSNVSGGENTASKTSAPYGLNWNLQKSGYIKSGDTYTYDLKYRVRLTNEKNGFIEKVSEETNKKTTLDYQIITTTNGNPAISPMKSLDFPVPEVEGYLAGFTFLKTDGLETPLPGAEFTLSHDTEKCSECRGNGTPVSIADQKAVSGNDGIVSFTNIPSGHKYVMTETDVPAHFMPDGSTFEVDVSYDSITVEQSREGVRSRWALDGSDTVPNPRGIYELQIQKVDSGTGAGRPLKGAEFSIYTDAECKTPARHPDGTEVGKLTTDENGTAVIGEVSFGTYYLREDKAPDGYYELSDIIVIAIDPNGAAIVTAKAGNADLTVTKVGNAGRYTITIPNTGGEELPFTGGAGTGAFTCAGTALLILSAALYGMRKNGNGASAMILAVLLCLALPLTSPAMSVLAAPNEMPDPDRKGSVSITFKYYDENTQETYPVTNGNSVGLFKVADIAVDNGFRFVTDSRFAKAGEIPAADAELDEMNPILAEKMAVIAQGLDFDAAPEYTDAEGGVSFKELDTGLYLVMQAEQGTGKDQFVIAPFLVAIPCRNPDGTLSYDVDASAKPIGIAKEEVPPPQNPSRLPQTGQLWWPAAILAAAGLLFVGIGMMRKRIKHFTLR